MITPWDIRNIRQALWGTFPMGSRDTFLVEDVNPGLRGTAAAALASRDPVHTIATLDVLPAHPLDLLFLAHRPPDFTGTNVLRRINRFSPPPGHSHDPGRLPGGRHPDPARRGARLHPGRFEGQLPSEFQGRGGGEDPGIHPCMPRLDP